MARLRPWAWLSAGVAGLTTATYLAVIVREGDNGLWDVAPWALLMLLGTGMALAAAVASSRSVRIFAAVAAAAILGLLGLLAIFSVGLGFLLAAGLAVGAALQSAGQRRSEPGNRT
jgi:hypothetical protein